MFCKKNIKFGEIASLKAFFRYTSLKSRNDVLFGAWDYILSKISWAFQPKNINAILIQPFAKSANGKAFTLAEILITLGIIGIIAALTIPSLLNQTQNTELKVGFKKMYSILNQALEKTTSENGNVPYECYLNQASWLTSQCVEFWASFKAQLNISKEYTGAVDGSIIPNYTGTDLINAQGGHNNNASCNGGYASGKSQKETWQLADGSMIISYNSTFATSWTYFFIDINGLKKPNKWGYDLFILDFRQKYLNASITIDDINCGSQEAGGYNISDILTK